MTRLYDLQDQLIAIDGILENNTNEETQEILESARAELLQAIDGKVENILEFISDCKAKAEQLKQREEQLYKKRKTIENKIDYLKSMLVWFMETNNTTKESYGDWDLTLAKTAGKVVLDVADDELPDWFKKATYTVDKTKLKEAMVNGKAYVPDIDGTPIQVAHIEESKSLRIK